MDAALASKYAIQQQVLIGESQTPPASCRTPACPACLVPYSTLAASDRRRLVVSRLTRKERSAETWIVLTRALIARRRSAVSRVHDARPTDDTPTHLGMHVFDPGMRFWPQPSQLKMPKYAAASNSGCVSFAALAVRGSAAATNELAAACAKNWRRDWSTARTRVLCCWRAGTRVLCCWRAHSCWRFATHTATRQKWRMAPMHWPLSALCTVPAQLAGVQSAWAPGA